MRRVRGRSFKITKNQAKSYGYAKARSMKPNPGVTTIAAINGRGAYRGRSARSVMGGHSPNARKAVARRRLSAAEKAAFKARMARGKRKHPAGISPAAKKRYDKRAAAGYFKNRTPSPAQRTTSRKNIRKAQSARKAWGRKVPRGKRIRVGSASYGRKPKARRLKAGVYIANRRGINDGLPADFDPRYQDIHVARAEARERAYRKSLARKKRAGKKAGSKTMARRRKRASTPTKKRRSSKRRRKSTAKTATPKRRRRKARKGAARRKTAATKTAKKHVANRRRHRRNAKASPKRRRSRKAKAAAPKRRRRRSRKGSARRAAPRKRRRVSRKRRSGGRRKLKANRRRRHRRNGSKRKLSSNRRRRSHRKSKGHKANRRRHRRNGRRLFKMNGVGDVVKMGAILFGGFALHRILTNLVSDQVLARLMPAPAAPAATSGFDLSGQRGLIASILVGAGGSFIASKVIKNPETKKLVIGGIVTSTIHGVIMSLLKAFAPSGADMLAGPEDGTAARLSAMYGMRGLGSGASIMPRYGVINGMGEYFREPMNGLGEYFATPMNGLGEYIAASSGTSGLGTYEANGDLYQAAAGFGAEDYQGNHIDPSGDLDRQLTIAEAAAGVGAVSPFEAAAGIGPMQAAAGFGAIDTVASGDTWIPGSVNPQLWAGVKAVSNGQSATEMTPAGILQTDGGQGIFG
jgi:hypothetical protein